MRYSSIIIKASLVAVSAFLSLQAEAVEEGSGTVEYANRKLLELHESLGAVPLPETDTIMYVPSITEEKELVFEFNSKGQVSHIGLALFSSEIKHMIDDDICRFVERFFLDLMIKKDNERIKDKLNEFEISLTLNGQKIGEGGFQSFPDILPVMTTSADFVLKDMGGRADAVWNCDGKVLRFSFPLYRELIRGTDKKESDMELYDILLNAVSESQCYHMPLDKPDKVTLSEEGLYVSKGEAGLLPSLQSDRYYILNNGEYIPLFSKEFPIHSMNNLFLTFRHGLDKTLQITHRQYGHLTPVVTIPIHNFLACFHGNYKTTCYTGYNKNGELETTVVLKHNSLNYIHILRAHITKEDLFGPSPVLKADFYSNIPQHYINTLLK